MHGSITDATADFYDCNIENVGVGLDQFDFNSGDASLGSGVDNLQTPAPTPTPEPTPEPSPEPSLRNPNS